MSRRIPWTTVRAHLRTAAYLRQQATEALAAHFAAHGFPSAVLHAKAEKATARYWFWDKKARRYHQFKLAPAARP